MRLRITLLLLLLITGCVRQKPVVEEISQWDQQIQALEQGLTDYVVIEESVTGEQLRGLAPHSGPLKRLEIFNAEGVSAEDLKWLPECPELSRLRLEFPVTDEQMAIIGDCDSLRMLNLPNGIFSDEGMQSLAGLENLELLRFGSPNVTDASLTVIASLPSLKFLHLIDVPVTDEGLKALHEKQELESFYLDGTNVTDDGLRALLKALPELHLHRDQLHLPEDPKGADHAAPDEKAD
ncbi:hypothetical protein [Rubinisphaera margarita]|uniref:hypothetical protein n=1 Tax=Rubinisphaera margarita TaxID=2909586 RepID=UPI001EE88FE6|nr:hypothetical protein [Rubinisphaera margarita]MCG6155429.1 hypothetical protein [Rubinisphaera margarita]